jgi:hypothetical protein
MSPVTKDTRTPGQLYEVYTCARRLHHGVDACAEPPIKRAAIDTSVFRYFEHVALDIDVNRQALRAEAKRKHRELDTLRQQALRQLAKAEEALTRVEGDYLSGQLRLDLWARYEPRLRADVDAARAEAEQHENRREAVSGLLEAFEVDAALLTQLGEYSRAVAGEVNASAGQGLDPVRMTLRRLFVGFELATREKPMGSGVFAGEGVLWTPPDDARRDVLEGRYWLLPFVRGAAVDLGAPAFSEGFPAVRRVGLPLSDNFHSLLAA